LSLEYFNRLAKTVPGVVKTLAAKGIHVNRLGFGGAGPPPARKPTVPTDARSEFLANRAMGDWAEKSLSAALVQAFPKWSVVQYGDTGRIAAGHPDFKQQYIAGLEETRLRGKRPDLLLFQQDLLVASDLSEIPQAETEQLVQKAIAAIEVRSSKFEALTYMRVRKTQRQAGTSSGRETQSFTVKVEDLVIVYRWLERHCVPQGYCQVFFDSIFAINVLKIFTTIASGQGYCIETPAKSQEKATIMIPITAGLQVGTATSLPTFRAEHRITALGRHDAYVVPDGGGFAIDPDKTRAVLIGPAEV
jgi:hypothetical protein